MSKVTQSFGNPPPAIGECAVNEKQGLLFAQLRGLGSLLVAFSGGADSAYLAWAAHRSLGANALAVTALSPSFSAHDRQEASEFAREAGLRHEFIDTSEFENPLYVANNADRCYHCKVELFRRLASLRATRDTARPADPMSRAPRGETAREFPF